MIETVNVVLTFLEQYIVTAIFAIGVIFFLYGFVNSFLLSRHDLGHPYLLRSLVLFAFALFLYGVVAFFLWLGTLGLLQTDQTPRIDSESNGFNRTPSTLPTPNVPTR